jgi:hypothetical protein
MAACMVHEWAVTHARVVREMCDTLVRYGRGTGRDTRVHRDPLSVCESDEALCLSLTQHRHQRNTGDIWVSVSFSVQAFQAARVTTYIEKALIAANVRHSQPVRRVCCFDDE